MTFLVFRFHSFTVPVEYPVAKYYELDENDKQFTFSALLSFTSPSYKIYYFLLI